MVDLPLPPVRPRFDLTINLGHVIILLTIVGGLVGSHYVGEFRLAIVERQNTSIEAKLDRLSSLVTDGAVLSERLKSYERRLELVEKR